MNSKWSKSLCILKYHMQETLITPKNGMVFLVSSIYLFKILSPVKDMCVQLGEHVTPFFFPFLSSDYIAQIMIAFGGIILLCNASHRDRNYLYLVSRSGVAAWKTGTILYIIAVCLCYLVFINIVGNLCLLPEIEWSSEWGKIWGTLVRTNASEVYRIPFQLNATVMKFKAYKAFFYSFFLEWICLVWLNLFIYLCNETIKEGSGVVFSGLWIFLDVVIYNAGLPLWIYKISPVTLCQLSYYNGWYAWQGITLIHTFMFYISSIIIMAGIVFYKRKRGIEE